MPPIILPILKHIETANTCASNPIGGNEGGKEMCKYDIIITNSSQHNVPIMSERKKIRMRLLFFLIICSAYHGRYCATSIGLK